MSGIKEFGSRHLLEPSSKTSEKKIPEKSTKKHKIGSEARIIESSHKFRLTREMQNPIPVVESYWYLGVY